MNKKKQRKKIKRLATKKPRKFKHERGVIPYNVIVENGFDQLPEKDEVYVREYGYPYIIFTKILMHNVGKHQLSVVLDWSQHNRKCTLLYTTPDGFIVKSLKVKSQERLEEIIKIFS